MAAAAVREIAAKGRQITLRQRARSFDAGSGQVTETVSDQSLRGLFTLYEAVQRDGSTVRQGDQALLLAADGLTSPPSEEDEVLDGDESWQVLQVERLQPGDKAIFYRLQLRR